MVRSPRVSGAGPDLAEERRLWLRGQRFVAGVDEVGRGPLAGPVVAGAAVFRPDTEMSAFGGVADSKTLSRKRVTAMAAFLRSAEAAEAGLMAYGLGAASVAEIDRLNIRRATALAMIRALTAVEGKLRVLTPDASLEHVLVDGLEVPELEWPQSPFVKGDRRVLSISVGAIIAKDTRDTLMERLSQHYPAFSCWASDMGYASPGHKEALKEHGPVDGHHRMSFAPLRQLSLF